MSKEERRQHPRFKAPDIIAMARVPESPLDYYFHVGNISLGGMALLTWSTTGFPIQKDAVLDLEVYSHMGSVRCRGVVMRLIPAEGSSPPGFGVQVYHHSPETGAKWTAIVQDAQKWGSA